MFCMKICGSVVEGFVIFPLGTCFLLTFGYTDFLIVFIWHITNYLGYNGLSSWFCSLFL